MKEKIIILLLTIILFSCSSEDNSITEPQEDPFAVELIASNTNVNIDGVATFEVKTNRAFSSITHFVDNLQLLKNRE
jgi:hypothetical protein